MKIYTKTGDAGETSLNGGTRVPKHHIRIESYGTVDELNSYVGLIRSQNIQEKYIKDLLEIQDRLFTIGAILASDPEKEIENIPALTEEDVLFLEAQIDSMNAELPAMKSFILQGGNSIVSYCHVARCVCRRAERNTIHLSETSAVSPIVIKYLNRLSDYLFVLARKKSKETNAEEIAWKPRV